MRAKGQTGRNQDVAWYAAFALGIAFSQEDDREAVRELQAAFARRPGAISPTLHHLSRLQGVDETTRERARTLVSRMANDIGPLSARTGSPA